MKPLYPEDLLPGWALPEATTLYWWTLREMTWITKVKADVPLSISSYKMKAFCWKEYDEMARKTNSHRPNSEQKPQAFAKRDPVRWINISLTDDDAVRLAEINATIDVLSADFVALVLSGWDISLKRQSKDGSYSATAITDDPHTTGGGVGLSGWSDNPVDALTSLLFKINYRLEDGIPAPTERASRRFR